MDLLREQAQVLTGNPETPIADLPPFDLASLKQCTLLDACLKETLRMHP